LCDTLRKQLLEELQKIPPKTRGSKKVVLPLEKPKLERQNAVCAEEKS
jgi:hypothetical protein